MPIGRAERRIGWTTGRGLPLEPDDGRSLWSRSSAPGAAPSGGQAGGDPGAVGDPPGSARPTRPRSTRRGPGRGGRRSALAWAGGSSGYCRSAKRPSRPSDRLEVARPDDDATWTAKRTPVRMRARVQAGTSPHTGLGGLCPSTASGETRPFALRRRSGYLPRRTMRVCPHLSRDAHVQWRRCPRWWRRSSPPSRSRPQPAPPPSSRRHELAGQPHLIVSGSVRPRRRAARSRARTAEQRPRAGLLVLLLDVGRSARRSSSSYRRAPAGRGAGRSPGPRRQGTRRGRAPTIAQAPVAFVSDPAWSCARLRSSFLSFARRRSLALRARELSRTSSSPSGSASASRAGTPARPRAVPERALDGRSSSE
jgi:hypothetical protein